MKLRNKKTGAIYKIEDIDLGNNADGIWIGLTKYNSLAELNEEWEDYEEPKEYWAIDQFGEPINVSGLNRLQLEKLHRLGNDFPSENATMKAIEKLKAWTRLKDKGFRFTAWKNGIFLDGTIAGQVRYEFPIDNKDDIEKDLDLLFSGEND